MKIQHLQVNWEDLPASEDIVLQPVEKSYLTIIYTEWAIFYLIIFLGGGTLFYLITSLQVPVLIFGALSVFLISTVCTYLLAKKSFRYRAYAIRERDVISRKGWFFQTLHIIPLSKIQHCIITTGPLEKKLQLATLKVFAAGPQSHITLSGLQAKDAEALKEWIIAKKDGHAQ